MICPLTKKAEREIHKPSYLCGLVVSYQFRIHRLQGCNELLWTLATVLHTRHWWKVNIQCRGQAEGREAASIQMKSNNKLLAGKNCKEKFDFILLSQLDSGSFACTFKSLPWTLQVMDNELILGQDHKCKWLLKVCKKKYTPPCNFYLHPCLYLLYWKVVLPYQSGHL